MYFHVGGYLDPEFLKLSADGSQGRMLKVSDQFPEASKFRFINSSVSPEGNLYILGGTTEGKIMLVRFDEDGTVDKPIEPRLPPKVIPSTIVATDSKTLLLFGFYDESAPSTLKGTGYMALLDGSSGAVRRELQESIPGLDVAKLPTGGAPPPNGTPGDDGNLYLVGSNQILVIAPDGDLLRRIPFDNPYPNSTASRLYVTGGHIIIVLSHDDEKRQVQSNYLVLLSSGGVVGYYEPSEQLGGWASTCYSPQQGFTFLKVDNRQLKIMNVPLP